MPQLASFSGIAIYMYNLDHNPPHLHVFYGGDEALVGINDGAVLAGGVPGRQLSKARAWIAEHRASLLARWAAMNP